MTLWLAIPLALLILAIILTLSSSIDFHFRFYKRGKDDLVEINVISLYGLIKLHYELPKLVFEGLKRGLRAKLEEQGTAISASGIDKEEKFDQERIKHWQDNIKVAMKSTHGLKKWFRTTVSHVKISMLDWSTDFSLGDAADTATAAGAVWGLKWSIIGYISQRVKLKRDPRLFVKPVFEDDLCFSMELVCRGRLSVAYALYAGLVLVINVLREKGGLTGWKKLLKQMRPEFNRKSLE